MGSRNCSRGARRAGLKTFSAEVEPTKMRIMNLQSNLVTRMIRFSAMVLAGLTVPVYAQDLNAVAGSGNEEDIVHLVQLKLEAEGEPGVEQFSAATREIRSCRQARDLAKSSQLEVSENEKVKVGSLPKPLQRVLSELQVGNASTVFGNPQQGFRVLVLCARQRA